MKVGSNQFSHNETKTETTRKIVDTWQVHHCGRVGQVQCH